jgi:octaprenyl-diphosphate synthase
MTLLKKPSLDAIIAPIQADLDAFNLALKHELSSDDELIQGIHEHILRMSGKFLRPVLSLLTSRLNGKHPEEAIRVALACELIHTATLVHDDIIDGSEWRRNQPSVHAKWGREISIVAGDYLYAKAFMILASLSDPKLHQAFAMCAHIMCEGEMKQIEMRKNYLMSEEAYLKIIHKKTAALFQAACMGGAYYAGVSFPQIESAGQYGYSLGMAFQIVDDCLDLVGETEKLGKKAGLDLSQNDVTLPILYLFSELEPSQQKKLLERFSRPDDRLFSDVKMWAAERGIVEKTMAQARRFSEAALEQLTQLPDSIYKESLRQLTDYCLERLH